MGSPQCQHCQIKGTLYTFDEIHSSNLKDFPANVVEGHSSILFEIKSLYRPH